MADALSPAPPHQTPYVQFSRIRLSDHLLPEAFATPAWPSGIVSSGCPGPLGVLSISQSPVLSSFGNPMKALPLPSPKALLSLRSHRYYGQLRLPYRPHGTSFPYIHQLLPCTASVRASRATPHDFPCVSPLLPRKPTDPFWQFSLRSVSQLSPNIQRVGNSNLLLRGYI